MSRKSFRRRSPSSRIARRDRLGLETLERRIVLTAVNPGNYNGTFNSDTEFLSTSGTYFIDGPLNVSNGATLTVGQGVNVVIRANQTLTVNGDMVVDDATIRMEEDNFSGPPVGIFINGSLTVDSTEFLRASSANDVSTLQVNAGGELNATGCTFEWDQVTLEDGALIDDGDVAENRFDSALLVPAVYVPLLTDNLSFRDVHLQAGMLGSGTLNLNLMGSAETANLRYVFPGSFTVDDDATLNIGKDVKVLIGVNQAITIDGALNINDADSISIAEDNFSGPPVGIFVNGTMTVTATSFLKASSANDISTLQVAAGGQLVASDCNFEWDELILQDGSILNESDLATNQFNTTLIVPATYVPLLSDNRRFQDIHLLPGTLSSGTLELIEIGTDTTVNLRYVFPGTYTVAAGATLNIGANVKVLIGTNQALTINGTLNINDAHSVAIAEDNFSGPPIGIFVNGELHVNSTDFIRASSANDVSTLQINAGGRLTATDSTFAWDRVTLADNSVLNNGDIVNNRFDTTLLVPAEHVPLFTNNRRFQDIELQPGVLGAATVTLAAIGTDTSVNLRYVFPGTFTIASDATLNVAKNVKVLIGVNQAVVVDGALHVTEADNIAIAEDHFSGPPVGIIVNGTMSVLKTDIVQASAANDVSTLLVNSGGKLTLLESNFDWEQLTVADGGTLTAFGTTFTAPVTLGAGVVAKLQHNLFDEGDLTINGDSDATTDVRFNDFSRIGPNHVVLTAAAAATFDLRENFWGSLNTATIDALIVDDEESGDARPAADFGDPIPLGAIGHRVWEDVDHDGLFDESEPGVANITVQIFNANTNALLQTTSTDAGGLYMFTGLAQVPYYIVYTRADPMRQVFAPANVLNDYQDSDAETGGRTATFSVAATSYNFHMDAGLWISEPPVLAGPGTINYQENQAAVRIATSATVSDADSANFNLGKLTVQFTAGGTASDRLSVLNNGSIAIVGSDVRFNGTSIGTASGGVGTAPLVITLKNTANAARVTTLLQSIGFANASDDPSTTARSVSFTLYDGDGGTSDPLNSTINVARLNDAPVLNNSLNPTLAAVAEDATNPAGTLVSALVSGAITDADSGAVRGIAVTATTNNSNGAWQYQLNGSSTWLDLETASSGAARLLPANARVRFVPNANFNGQVKLWYRAWDQTQGSAGGTLAETGNTGGTKSLSTALENASLTVTAVNDAPVLAAGRPSLNTIQEDAPNPTGTLVSNFANPKISDVDAGALKGIAVVALTEKTRGTWQFSTNGGTTWTNFGNPSSTAARVLTPNARVRFVPSANYTGTPQLTFRAWDQTNGLASGSVVDTTGKQGGTGAYSATTINAVQSITAVNDKPQLTLSGSLGYKRNDPAVVLAPNALVTDPDSANFGGGQLRVRITLGGGNNNTLAIGSGFTVDANNNVKFGTTIIGKRLSNGIGTNELRIQFNSSATKALVEQLVRSITYRNVGGSAGQRTIVFTVSDGDGGLSDARTKTVNVT